MTTERVRADLVELHRGIGFRNPVSWEPLERLYKSADCVGLCRAIGQQMGLKNEVRLGSVSAGVRFRTRALSTTDPSGRGTHGIVAQVAIPESMPLYGTAAFERHVVDILLGDDFGKVPPATAVALLAHEMSHVLLHALHHPKRDSEQFTDLVPLALGFASIVAAGRTTTKTEHVGQTAVTRRTTYGYMDDEEFTAARAVVEEIVGRTADRIRELRDLKGALRARALKCTRALDEAEWRLRDLDEKRASVRPKDAARVVALHRPGYFDEQRHEIVRAEPALAAELGQAPDVQRFTAPLQAQVEQAIAACRDAMGRLGPVEARVLADVGMLRRNLPVWQRLRERVHEFRDAVVRRVRKS